MEFRQRPLGFIDFFAKQQSPGSKENQMNRKSKKYTHKTVRILYDS